MNIEQAKEVASKALQHLSESLAQGQSEVLRNYLAAMEKFHHYSASNILLIMIQRAVTCCYTSLESMNMRLYALLEASDGEYHIC